MSEEQKVIKVIVPAMCPHCSKEIMVAHRIFTPMIEWVLKREDLDSSKDTVRKAVKEAKYKTEKEREDILLWIDDKDVLFGPAEVKNILEQVIPKE